MTTQEERSYKALRRLRPAQITYTAGAFNIPLIAIRGLTDDQVHPLGNVVTNSRSEDFLILVSELVYDNQPIEPTPGHRITQIINGVAETFEVIRKDDRTCWRFVGADHSVMRVHTKLL